MSRMSKAVILSLLFGLIGCCQDSTVKEMEKRNKALMQRIHAEVSKGNLEIFDEVLAPDYVRHCQAMPPEFQEIRVEGSPSVPTVFSRTRGFLPGSPPFSIGRLLPGPASDRGEGGFLVHIHGDKRLGNLP